MIGLLLLAATVGVADLPAETRYDLTCVEAASWALSWMKGPANKEAHDNVQAVSIFFLGRLSGRDNDTDWVMTAATEIRTKRQSEAYYSDALTGCGQRMYEKIMPKLKL